MELREYQPEKPHDERFRYVKLCVFRLRFVAFSGRLLHDTDRHQHLAAQFQFLRSLGGEQSFVPAAAGEELFLDVVLWVVVDHVLFFDVRFGVVFGRCYHVGMKTDILENHIRFLRLLNRLYLSLNNDKKIE